MNDRAFIAALRLVPKNALSRAVGAATRLPLPGAGRAAASWAPSPAATGSTSPSAATSPASGPSASSSPGRSGPGCARWPPGDDVRGLPGGRAWSRRPGSPRGGRLVQAKGIDYTASALVGDERVGARLAGGRYATLYLSPRDYHRIHFPLGGRVLGWRYVPGKLWPVNPASVRTVPGLFTVNERLVTLLDSPLGLVAIVAVGATVVGRVRATFDPEVPGDQPGRGRGAGAGLRHAHPGREGAGARRLRDGLHGDPALRAGTGGLRALARRRAPGCGWARPSAAARFDRAGTVV